MKILNEIKSPTFETSDFYLASFLHTQGFKIINVRHEGKRATFIFEDQPERSNLIKEFYNNEVLVKPLDFKDAIKNMRALTYNY